MKNGILIKCNQVSAEQNGKLIINNMSLLLGRGEIIQLLGPDDEGRDALPAILRGTASVISGSLLSEPENIKCYYSGTSKKRSVIEEIGNCTILDYLFLLDREESRKWTWNRKSKRNLAKEYIDSLGMEYEPETKLCEIKSSGLLLLDIIKAERNGADLLIIEHDFDDFDEDDYHLIKNRLEQSRSKGLSALIINNNLQSGRNLADHILFFDKKYLLWKKTPDKCSDLIIDETTDLRSSIKEESDTAIARLCGKKQGSDEGIPIYPSQILVLGFKNRIREEEVFRCFSGENNENDHYYLDRKAKRDLRIAVSRLNENELFTNLGIKENLMLPSWKKLPLYGMFDLNRIETLAQRDMMGDQSGNIEYLLKPDKINLLLDRWLIYRPDIMVLLEPNSYYDPEILKSIRDHCKKFAAAGCSVVILSTAAGSLSDLEYRCYHLN